MPENGPYDNQTWVTLSHDKWSRGELVAEVERLREEVRMLQGVASRWRCCDAGLIAAPDPCPWHGDGVRDDR